MSKKLFDKLVDGEASSPATATLSRFFRGKICAVVAVHAANHDWNSRGSKPSRAFLEFFDGLSSL